MRCVVGFRGIGQHALNGGEEAQRAELRTGLILVEQRGIHLVVVHLLLQREHLAVELRERLQRLGILGLSLGGITHGFAVLSHQFTLH